ncbi:TIGR04222 domain-containing protein [Streptomyces sp. DvalAA-14]|uniref:TIGR04222 domain-containing membrane protein n=1 Tax=unclassified Streptomyces TaxID=2593676 RepID=UPI00081B126C|nr:TIGR04222 domain-containing membrane protein [Streptomyces sp. DvalAA-14]MYS22375.1 TIGR04222 domain-containing membrane protein [Streptomyces sp. SID4948]SCE14789.1 TIGR04222 domain-containing protein [Streptomyces sp. DvalAA-14]
MNEPWGLSGPRFLEVYAVALLVAWALALLIRRVLLWARRTDSDPVDVYTLALLSGGAARVVDTAVQALVAEDRLRVARNHTITSCGRGTPDDPVQQAVLSCVEYVRSTNIGGVRRLAAPSAAVRAVTASAVARRLVLGSARRRAVRATALLPALVFAVGVARLVNGVRLHRPVGFLAGALIGTAVLLLMLLVPAARGSRLTTAGVRARDSARARSASDRRRHGFYAATGAAVPTAVPAAVPAAVLGVAVLGAAGVEDATLRSALYGSLAASSASGGGGSSGYSCGGASGCGGGSCGGGGGGGGCGG